MLKPATYAFCSLILLATIPVVSSGYHPEIVKGLGLGVDVHSKGDNPQPAIGLLYAEFGYLSYQARASFSHRIADNTSFIRGGVGLGFALVLLNIDFTYQTGIQKSAGMFFGLSSFISGGWFTPEIFAGYQMNFAGGTDNFFLAGGRFYLNFVEISKE